MNNVRIINEPTAAAIAHGLDVTNQDEELFYLVIDIGANNLEVTLLGVEEGIFEILQSRTEENCGGNQIDEILVNHCIEQFNKQTGVNLSQNLKAIAKLRKECEQAKKVLQNLI